MGRRRTREELRELGRLIDAQQAELRQERRNRVRREAHPRGRINPRWRRD